MHMLFRSLLLSVVLLLVTGVTSAQADYKLELVQVIHRHGARSPIVSYNETQICGLEYPCGILNSVGEAMLVNVGSFLRDWYMNNEPNLIGSQTFFPAAYNVSFSSSRSTDVLRTLQSSSAFLRGLFPAQGSLYPAIHSVSIEEDFLLSTSTVPEVTLRRRMPELVGERELCDPLVDYFFPHLSVLQRISAEVYSEGYCSDPHNRTKCACQLCDIGRAYQSLGTLGAYPLLNIHLESVCAVLACSNACIFGYDPLNATDATRGSFGQPLAQRLVENIADYISTPQYKLYEYSVHDSTLSMLGTTIGRNSSILAEPPFGTTFILELLSKNDAHFVRLRLGYPSRTANYTFAFTDFAMTCSNGLESYTAVDGICPFIDFASYINRSASTDPRGRCTLSPTFNQMIQRCNTTHSPPLPWYCNYYQKHCTSNTPYFLPSPTDSPATQITSTATSLPYSILYFCLFTIVTAIIAFTILRLSVKLSSHPHPTTILTDGP